MTTYAIQVSGLSPSTTETQLSEFFSFCGKISSIDHSPSTQSATIHFEKPSAAKTALMLNGGNLDGANLTVISEKEHPDEVPSSPHHDGGFDQSDKPRAGIAAEYLARGYVLSDHVLQHAIELDKKHGISSRFLNYMQSLDTTLGEKALGPQKTLSSKVQETLATATQQARTIDAQKGYSKQATDYYSRAVVSPWGQKVMSFYTTTSKQALDIHEEARRIATVHKQHRAADSVNTDSSTGVGSAAPPLDAQVYTEAAPGPEDKA
ncbi:uncharacterized protein FIBRA_09224 [Fibroporia radiculosa]|uniref:RRM domain-containing protein n=1 Tax=Fibroporia radiculosa TaxID=599839 RepID=J7RH65_9APHY|nr:uncharacterized protein FIBRA_09224 [Fibroporia radiculosa]CCM06912.1 predicted protein [Fibroporia radiculosa]